MPHGEQLRTLLIAIVAGDAFVLFMGLVGLFPLILARANLKARGWVPLRASEDREDALGFIFSGRHAGMNDPFLSRLVWAFRLVLILCPAVIVAVAVAHGVSERLGMLGS